MSGLVSQFRDEVYAALQGAVGDFPWRVHRTADTQPAAPVIFIDSPSLQTGASGIVNVALPVVIVVDGSIAAQVDALDDFLARVWGPLARVGNVSDSRPAVLDVGGPSLRAQIVNVSVDVTAGSLCPPELLAVSP